MAAALSLVSLAASGQEATGRWNASIETDQGAFSMVFEFIVEGMTLLGTMSNEFIGSTPISDGTTNGKDVAFKLKLEGGPDGPVTISYKGTINGDQLSLTSKFEGAPPAGGPAELTFTATRAE